MILRVKDNLKFVVMYQIKAAQQKEIILHPLKVIYLIISVWGYELEKSVQ